VLPLVRTPLPRRDLGILFGQANKGRVSTMSYIRQRPTMCAAWSPLNREDFLHSMLAFALSVGPWEVISHARTITSEMGREGHGRFRPWLAASLVAVIIILSTSYGGTSTSLQQGLEHLVLSESGGVNRPAGLASHMLSQNNGPAEGQGVVARTVDLLNGSVLPGNYPVSSCNAPDSLVPAPSSDELAITCRGEESLEEVNGTTGAIVKSVPLGAIPVDCVFDAYNGYVYVTAGANVAVVDLSGGRVVSSIPIGHTPQGLVFDPINNEIYVADGTYGSFSHLDNITVIDGATNEIANTIRVGWDPVFIALDNSNGNLYVTNYGTNNVSIISGNNDAVISTVHVGYDPDGVVYDNTNGNIYVANYWSSNLSVICGSNNSLLGTIKLVGLAYPVEVAYDAIENTIYMSNEVTPGYMDVLSGLNNSLVKKIPVPFGTVDIAYDPGRDVVFATGVVSDELSVIAGSGGVVTSSFTLAIRPQGVVYDSLNGEIYVASMGGGEDCGGSGCYVSAAIQALNGSSDRPLASVPLMPDSQPSGIAFDSANGDVYVTDSGSDNVSVLNGSTNSIATTISVAASPEGVAYDSGNGNIYVANGGSENVSVISGVTNRVVTSIPLNIGTPTPGNAVPHQPPPPPSDLWGIAYDNTSGDLYVTNFYSGNVSVIFGSNNTSIGSVPIDSNPWGVAYDKANGDIYVSDYWSKNVSVISAANNTVVASIPVGIEPMGLAVDEKSGFVYVADSGSDTVSVISGKAVIDTIAVGATPSYVAYDDGSGSIYVTDTGESSLSVIAPLAGLSSVNVTPPSVTLPSWANQTFAAVPFCVGGYCPNGINYSWSFPPFQHFGRLNRTYGPSVSFSVNLTGSGGSGATVGGYSNQVGPHPAYVVLTEFLTLAASLDGVVRYSNATIDALAGTPWVTPSGPASIYAGASWLFHVTWYCLPVASGSEQCPTFFWSLTNKLGSLNASAGPVVRFTAGSETGTVTLFVNGTLDGKSVQSPPLTITILPAPPSTPSALFLGYVIAGVVVMPAAIGIYIALLLWRRYRPPPN